jgi:hypothetical protein
MRELYWELHCQYWELYWELLGAAAAAAGKGKAKGHRAPGTGGRSAGHAAWGASRSLPKEGEGKARSGGRGAIGASQ